MESKVNKTIRVDLELWRNLNSMRGFNDCDSFADVVRFLYNKHKESEDDKNDIH